jgi:predicted nucleic acid-binding protein
VSPAPKGLLDTSVVVELAGLDPDDLPDLPLISAVTLAELSAVVPIASTVAQASARQARLQFVESVFDPLPFDAACARAFAVVSASLRAAGRKPAARAFDALIAATSLANGLPLWTLNPEDYRHIEGLDVHVPARAKP